MIEVLVAVSKVPLPQVDGVVLEYHLMVPYAGYNGNPTSRVVSLPRQIEWGAVMVAGSVTRFTVIVAEAQELAPQTFSYRA